jgi:predicted lipid-binding transport protein (Tim44 family)
MESYVTTRTGTIARIILAAGIAATLVGAPADARRGGSFGSRGSHTYSSPGATRLSPGYTAPVSRSMTDRPAYGASPYAPSYQQPRYAPTSRPGLFHGFGGGLLTGLVAGGLIGHFFGHGYGGGWGGAGGGGLLATLFQIALIGGGIWLVMRLFRGRSPAPSAMPDAYQTGSFAGAPAYAPPLQDGDLALSPSDQQAFERLLLEVQDAFSKEDYARLRTITTPEIMSYLAEELSDNATHGRRNDVSATRLLDGEVSEAWSEDDRDYATIAMRYESVDVMRDRTSGAILAGSALAPTETTEIWTFVRPAGGYGDWKVSAIQDA